MQKKSSDRMGKCAHCNMTCSQSVFYAKQHIEHRRCSECGEVNVFGLVADEENGSSGKREWKQIEYDQIMKFRTLDSPPRYVTQNNYTEGDFLNHPQFGEGYVVLILPPRKMKVIFDGQVKLLICGEGSQKGPAPAASPRKRKKK